ncbi:MAG: DUF502 domain-containing protein [Planctomycetota bacterium]
MKKALEWLWKTGIVSTFLAGLFVVLPIAITIGLMSWVGGTLAGWFGSGTFVGEALKKVGGLKFETSETLALVAGWVIVLTAIWLLGVLVKSIGKNTVAKTFDAALERIPIINILYKPVAQVVGMLKQDGQEEMKGMSVVYCAFGGEGGAGFLGLLVSERVYHFAGQDYQIVYIPTSPVPMSGGILFAPVKTVHCVDMTVDDLMQIYFSIGVMSSKIIPEKYVTS